jgi:hypothetical protein
MQLENFIELLLSGKVRSVWRGQQYNSSDGTISPDNCSSILIVNEGLDNIMVGGTLLKAGPALNPTTYVVVPPNTSGAIPTTGDSFTDQYWPFVKNGSQYAVTNTTNYGPTILYIRRQYYDFLK